MNAQINETIRLGGHTVTSGRVVGEWGELVVDTQAVRLMLHSRYPGVLRDLGHVLIDLADDLEVAQRPYVGDEDAERSPGLALMRKGIAEMRDRVARGDEDADRGDAEIPTFARLSKRTRTFRMRANRGTEA